MGTTIEFHFDVLQIVSHPSCHPWTYRRPHPCGPDGICVKVTFIIQQLTLTCTTKKCDKMRLVHIPLILTTQRAQIILTWSQWRCRGRTPCTICRWRRSDWRTSSWPGSARWMCHPRQRSAGSGRIHDFAVQIGQNFGRHQKRRFGQNPRIYVWTKITCDVRNWLSTIILITEGE